MLTRRFEMQEIFRNFIINLCGKPYPIITFFQQTRACIPMVQYLDHEELVDSTKETPSGMFLFWTCQGMRYSQTPAET